MKKRLLFLYILLSLTALVDLLASEVKEPNYGLFIKSEIHESSGKTSFILEDGKPIKLAKNTTLSFDLQVRPEMVFGIVSRIITENNDNIDLTFTVGEDDKRYPMLVVNESVYILPREIKVSKWTSVSINLSSENNIITTTYDGDTISAPGKELSKNNSARIYFGLCTLDGFKQNDIASINIRDIKISNNDQLIRHWKLDKHEEGKSLDLIAGSPAVAINERWLSDIYASWTKIYSKSVNNNSHITYNKQEGVFYIVQQNSDEIIKYNTKDKKEEIIKTKSVFLSSNAPNQIFYNPKNKEILFFNIDETQFSSFNFNRNSWSNNLKANVEHGYWNNSFSYYPADSVLISFGGYGFYKYNNELLRINPYTNSIKKTILPDITPRYNAATVIVDNTLYIFGGRGNKSGRQELSPRNYYDFYAVNLKTEQTNLLWSIDASEINMNLHFLPGENLRYDKEQDCFYVFANIGGGSLLRLNKKSKGFDLVAFPIEEKFNSDYLHMNLYFNSDLKELYGITYKENFKTGGEINIYSLKYPPTTVIQNYNLVETKTEKADTRLLTIVLKIGSALLILSVLLGCAYYYYIWQRKKKSKGESDKKQQIKTQNKQSEIVKDNGVSLSSDINVRKKENYYDFSKQSISLLGSFSVRDKEGNNITSQFTPMLKHLLIILLLSTTKDGRGITGRKFTQLFWFDKDQSSANNNRNVYLSKLRSILENVGDININNINKFWSIQLPADTTCDYIEISRLSSMTDEAYNEIPKEEKTERLLELLLRGDFLPNTEEDWLDDYKSDFSNLTIDILTNFLQDNSLSFSDNTKMKIADTIFLHDPLNEEALYVKCSILFYNDKKGLAKTTYDNFQKEHTSLLGAEHKKTLNEIINKD